jgi:hypothetical protein
VRRDDVAVDAPRCELLGHPTEAARGVEGNCGGAATGCPALARRWYDAGIDGGGRTFSASAKTDTTLKCHG